MERTLARVRPVFGGEAGDISRHRAVVRWDRSGLEGREELGWVRDTRVSRQALCISPSSFSSLWLALDQYGVL